VYIKLDSVPNSIKPVSTFGKFDNFPDHIHGRLKVGHRTSTLKMFQIIVQTLYKLNNFTTKLNLGDTGHSKHQEKLMVFEVGIADGSYFQFLDHETLTKLCDYHQLVKNQQISVLLDVLVIISYYYYSHDKKISLNSDHNILRFLITSRVLNIYLYNAKGIRRFPLDQFLQRLFDKIHEETKRQHLKTFKIEAFNTL
jgi:hypothetical protein